MPHPFGFFEKKSQTVRRDFLRAVPRDVRDGRMVDGDTDGRGAVAIAHRGPCAGWSMVGELAGTTAATTRTADG
jgi:hypothetical protein